MERQIEVLPFGVINIFSKWTCARTRHIGTGTRRNLRVYDYGL